MKLEHRVHVKPDDKWILKEYKNEPSSNKKGLAIARPFKEFIS